MYKMAIWLIIKEWNSFASVSTTTSSSNSMYVIFNGVGEIKINNMLNIFNVQASRCNWSCHKNLTFSRTEIVKSYLSLSLLPVSVKKTIRKSLKFAVIRCKLRGSQTEAVLKKKTSPSHSPFRFSEFVMY